MAEEKTKLLNTARQQVQAQTTVELQDLRNQLAERDKKLSVAQEEELSLRKQQRELEAAKGALELEAARTLDSELTKIPKRLAKPPPKPSDSMNLR